MQFFYLELLGFLGLGLFLRQLLRQEDGACFVTNGVGQVKMHQVDPFARNQPGFFEQFSFGRFQPLLSGITSSFRNLPAICTQ